MEGSTKNWLRVICALMAIWLCIPSGLWAEPDHSEGAPQQTKGDVAFRPCGPLPLAFEPNLGQSYSEAAFITRTAQGTLYLTPHALILVLNCPLPCAGDTAASSQNFFPRSDLSIVRLTFRGANPSPQLVGQEKLPGISNVYLGNDPSRWRWGLPTYAQVRYKDLYPGVDLVVYGRQGSLEYDLEVAPGADPAAVSFGLEDGYGRPLFMKLKPNGDLSTTLSGVSLTHKRPLIFQESDETRQEVAGAYRLFPDGMLGFDVGPYNRQEPLVIDPVLDYSTFLGGVGQDAAFGIAVDRSGSVYTTGYTASGDFPVVGSASGHGLYDLFVTKISPDGSTWAYSTVIGGSDSDYGEGIAVDQNDEAFVTGGTRSGSDFPVVDGYPLAPTSSQDNAFVLRLSDSGEILYSTLLGGNGNTDGFGIAVDDMHHAYVTGDTTAFDLPLSNPLQLSLTGSQDAFVAVIDTTKTGAASLAFSTFLGGHAYEQSRGIALDLDGDVFVVGSTFSSDFPVTPSTAFQPSLASPPDAFLAEIRIPSEAAPSLAYSTYLGGKDEDHAYAVAASPRGGVFLTGDTASTDFPLVKPTQGIIGGGLRDIFLSWVDTAQEGGAGLLFSTLLGGSGSDTAYGLAVSSQGNPKITGVTASTDFPLVSPLPGQDAFGGPPEDAFVAGWSVPTDSTSPASPVLAFSTYLGGANDDFAEGVAIDESGDIYVSGGTQSINLPTLNAAQPSSGGSYDAFVTKLEMSQGCTLTCSALASPSTGQSPLLVNFAGIVTTQGCDCSFSYSWAFGDGSTSASQNPKHLYSRPGQYDWTFTATCGKDSCDASGTVTVYPCNLSCTAAVSQNTGTTESTFHFIGGYTTTCNNQPVFLWDFGDGTTSDKQVEGHTYTAPGTYAWTFTVTLGEVSCSSSGKVYVAPYVGAAAGFVGLGEGQTIWPFSTTQPGGVMDLSVHAKNEATGQQSDAMMTGSQYYFPSLAAGDYHLWATLTYADNITVDNSAGGLGGCAAPGAINRYVESAPLVLTISADGPPVFTNILFPPPLVMLHGNFGCFSQFDNWVGGALGQGFLVFAPNYQWWDGDASWPSRADQVLGQIQADLTGLSVDATPADRVEVLVSEVDGRDAVELVQGGTK